MRRIFVVLAAVGLVAGGVVNAAQTATASPAVRDIPAFTCGTTQFALDTNAGFGYFNNSINRLTVENSYTAYCSDYSGPGQEFDIVGENNCLTYAGPKTGKVPLGYVDKTTCNSTHQSELWTWSPQGDGTLRNLYTNWCLDGPTSGGKPFLAPCDSRNSAQHWTADGIAAAAASASP